MNIIANPLPDIKKRWGVDGEPNRKKEFEKFRARIHNVFKGIDRCITTEGINQFSQIVGVRNESSKWFKNCTIANCLYREKDEVEYYSLLEIIFQLPFEDKRDEMNELYVTASGTSVRDVLFDRFVEVVELSNVNLSAVKIGEKVVLYPRGEQKLDEKLVNGVLSFLSGGAEQHFVDALRFYEKKTKKDSIKSAESVRRSIEEFLKLKLDNKKGLAANIGELQTRLKNQGKDTAVRNVIYSTLSYLDNYFNENSKHKDGNIEPPENEYLIYQAGLLMRYINGVV